MILLAFVSVVLFLTTYAIGICTEILVRKFFKIDIHFNFFETFLFGLISSFIYFNLLSFFGPINYFTLLPLLLVAILTSAQKEIRHNFQQRSLSLFYFFFNKSKSPFTIPFLCLFVFYWIIPPVNADSAEYHYLAIRWYEQFKIVPGLANVHGRLAFNPASFIISSAWSFTDITRQALYPLNGIIVLIFYAWLIKTIFFQNNFWQQLVWFVGAVLSLRLTLANISSPSSDLLAGILLLYCGLKTYELISINKNELQDYFPVLILSCFAVTAKLSAIPALLLLPFIYFVVVKKRTASFFFKSLLLCGCIIVPWLARNFILSGYLLYPIPATNFFHVDWAAPHNVIQLDLLYSKYGPRTASVSFFDMQKMNIVQLTKVWFDHMIKSSLSSLAIAMFSFLSITTWIFFAVLKIKISYRPFLLWVIYYVCVCIWFTNSPEHRFGLPYLILAIVIPFLEMTKATSKKWALSGVFFFLLTVALSFHYIISTAKKSEVYPFTLADCWLLPLKDQRYLPASTNPNYLKNFRSVDLGNGVKLYVRDGNHECLNAPGPCMSWPYGEIEMRGKKIEDGFRTKKDEVKKYFPFVSP